MNALLDLIITHEPRVKVLRSSSVNHQDCHSIWEYTRPIIPDAFSVMGERIGNGLIQYRG